MGQYLGHRILSGFTGEVLCSSWAKARLVNLDGRSQVLVSFSGDQFKGAHKGKTLGARQYAYHEAVWESYQELACICASWLVSVQGPCRLLGHTNRMPKQQYYGVV